MGEAGRERVKSNAEAEENEISDFPADLVRQRGPEDAPRDVEERQEPDEARRDGGDRCLLAGIERRETEFRLAEERAAEDLLKHGRSDGEDADAGRDIQAEHHPDQPELRRLMRILKM